jgi:cell division initiation protein
MSDRLSAMDIEGQEFPKKMRGYSPEEVRMYLRSVAEEFQHLNLNNQELRQAVANLEEKLEEIQAREEMLQKTLVSAQAMSDDMKESARREAELVVRESRVKGERLLEQAQDQLSRVEAEIGRTRLERNSFDSRLRAILEEHISMLDLREEERTDNENLRFLHRRSESETG